ncbi:hypothetical protein AV530_015464 [Patagioenas fasciata monilis]|uniref:Uncharacterized protein n=1 Tax=Patagioenas fasciata monilis TaxID=372326 RepID=A0A1V4KRQ9_PATFA|nr:hypothetical protein AV530_015464 [Patagioenas fasciata monilis]
MLRLGTAPAARGEGAWRHRPAVTSFWKDQCEHNYTFLIESYELLQDLRRSENAVDLCKPPNFLNYFDTG